MNYYVSTTGNNANDGSLGSPWLTLDYALSYTGLAPGDTINLAAGTYSSAANTDISGTNGSPITIQGAGAASTTVNGLLTIDEDYYIVRGITFSTYYLKISGTTGTNEGSYNIVEDCIFTGNSQGVYIFQNTTSGLFGPSYNIIRNNTFTSPVGNGMVTIGGHHNTVENNTFTNNRGYDAIRVGGIGHVFRGNTFNGINNPIVVSVTSATSSGGVVTVVTATPHDIDNNSGVVVAGANESAFNTEASGRTATVINATTFTYVPLVDPGDGVSATGTVTAQAANHADVIQAFAGGGYITRDILFEKNFIIDSSGQWGNIEGEATNTEVSAFTIRNNLHINSTLQFNIFVPDCKFYNNTVYNTSGSNGVRFIGTVPSRGVANNAQVFNNLFIRIGVTSVGGAYSLETISGASADYNIITNKTDGSQSGYSEVHGINGGYTPSQIFMDVDSDDFRLRVDSPAIGIGADLSGEFTDDILGDTRTLPWDIGAYKASGPTAPTSLSSVAVGSATINLSWTDNSSDETGFKVERSTDGSTWSQIATVGAGVTSYTDSNLYGGTYYYRVRAYNDNGNSAYSNTANTTILPRRRRVGSRLKFKAYA